MTRLTELCLVRTSTGPEGTFGVLKDANGAVLYHTAELPEDGGRASVHNEREVDCIPAGTYVCTLVKSPKFGLVYEVTNIPNRSHVLIHAGNYAGNVDRGFKSHVKGCIILGTKMGVLDGQMAVKESKVALASFMNTMQGRDFVLMISWDR